MNVIEISSKHEILTDGVRCENGYPSLALYGPAWVSVTNPDRADSIPLEFGSSTHLSIADTW